MWRTFAGPGSRAECWLLRTMLAVSSRLGGARAAWTLAQAGEAERQPEAATACRSFSSPRRWRTGAAMGTPRGCASGEGRRLWASRGPPRCLRRDGSSTLIPVQRAQNTAPVPTRLDTSATAAVHGRLAGKHLRSSALALPGVPCRPLAVGDHAPSRTLAFARAFAKRRISGRFIFSPGLSCRAARLTLPPGWADKPY